MANTFSSSFECHMRQYVNKSKLNTLFLSLLMASLIFICYFECITSRLWFVLKRFICFNECPHILLQWMNELQNNYMGRIIRIFIVVSSFWRISTAWDVGITLLFISKVPLLSYFIVKLSGQSKHYELPVQILSTIHLETHQ